MGRPYKIIFLVIILGITATYAVADAQNKYCNIESCQRPVPQNHTSCVFKKNELGDTCTRHFLIISNNLNDSEKIDIVQRHNELRQYVAAGKEQRGFPGPQPAAMFMPNLTWNNELARLAQTTANQCMGDFIYCNDVARFRVNQLEGNYIGLHDTNALPSVRDIIIDWYNEVVNFDPNHFLRSYKFHEKYDHYTQIVWARTRKIGCGQIILKPLPPIIQGDEVSTNDDYYVKLFYCNYGPAGNEEDQKVYDQEV